MGGRAAAVADQRRRAAGGLRRLGDIAVGHAQEHRVRARDRLAAAGRPVHVEARVAKGAGQGCAQAAGPDD